MYLTMYFFLPIVAKMSQKVHIILEWMAEDRQHSHIKQPAQEVRLKMFG